MIIAAYEPCTCEAYPDPHKPMIGECYGHNMADCPHPQYVRDPHGTGDHWYRWVEHGCKLKPGARIAT